MPKRILVVDDSASSREVIACALLPAGFEVLEAEDGEAALERLALQGVDLVLTDLNMPRMDGLALLQALRSRPATRFLPVLVITTETGGETKRRAREEGATGWIAKPFDAERMVEAIRRVLPGA